MSGPKRRKPRRVYGWMLPADKRTCARCHQHIGDHERAAAARLGIRGAQAHHGCVRLAVALPRPRTPQESAGWGQACALCGGVIEHPTPWRQIPGGVIHARGCP